MAVETDPSPEDTIILTKLEETIWVSAYCSNQPQPRGYKGGGNIETAIYWAGSAVYHFQGKDLPPTEQECLALFRYMQNRNKQSK